MSPAGRPHGTRARYVAERCRCEPCTAANREYASYQAKRKRLEALGRTDGPWAAPIVDAAAARDHLAALAAGAIGYKRAAALAGVAVNSVAAIRAGRARCRRETAEAILALPLDADPADGTLVDGHHTRLLLRRILRRTGWTKRRLAAELGWGSSIQRAKRPMVLRSTKRDVERLAARLGIVTADARRLTFEMPTGHTITGVALAAGVDRQQVRRWCDTGIPEAWADRLAVLLGLHPAELCPDWWEAA